MFSPYLYTKFFFFMRFIISIKMATTIRRQPLNIFLSIYQRTGKRMAPQHKRSTSMKTCCHMAYSDCPSSLSSIMMQAMLSRIYNVRAHSQTIVSQHHSTVKCICQEMKEMFQTISTSISKLLHNACTTQAIPSSVYSFCT